MPSGGTARVDRVTSASSATPGAAAVRSNTFSLEWPPRSGRVQEFPEIDRAAWCGLDEARVKLVTGQVPYLDRLRALLEH